MSVAVEPLVIDVATIDSWHAAPAGASPVVLVEPLYGSVAVGLALDAGWGSVELAPGLESAAPIPLVSFEVPAPAVEGDADRRCRVRSTDLHAAARCVEGAGAVLVGSIANARPLASRLATLLEACERVTFLLAPSGDTTLTSDAAWASGVLIRILLEELERASALTDAAGIAVTLAQGAEDPAAQLTAGTRWTRHLEGGGNADDLRVAGSVDTIGAVPRLHVEGDALVARA
ncbi:MAG: hypothetical protein JWM86_13 [Thermoleophilia bacterium]|nr:hypothetical protein [Thermoleophilia bacterium]